MFIFEYEFGFFFSLHAVCLHCIHKCYYTATVIDIFDITDLREIVWNADEWHTCTYDMYPEWILKNNKDTDQVSKLDIL